MKRILLFGLLFYSITIYCQTTDVIVQWTFPDSALATGANSDGGMPQNIGIPITSNGGTNSLTFNRTGASTFCARSLGWDGGMGSKFWQIRFSTNNYNTLKLSSVQESATSSNGPRDFKVQYTTSLLGTWTDVPLATVLDSNDWSHGVLSNIDLPTACNNQDSVYLRWIMTSNISVSGGTVASNGPSKIDDIYVTGIQIPTNIQSSDVPTDLIFNQNTIENTVTVLSSESIKSVTVYDIIGNMVYYNEKNASSFTINTSLYRKGIYIMKMTFSDNHLLTRKVVF